MFPYLDDKNTFFPKEYRLIHNHFTHHNSIQKKQYHPQYERHIQIYDYATPYVVLSDVLIELYVNDLTKNSPHKSKATLSPDQRYQDIDMLLLEKAYQTESQRWNQYLFRQFF